MYDQLYFILSSLQPMCWDADMAMLPWGAIAMADFVRGITTAAEFLEMMDLIGVVGAHDYGAIGQCIVDVAAK